MRALSNASRTEEIENKYWKTAKCFIQISSLPSANSQWFCGVKNLFLNHSYKNIDCFYRLFKMYKAGLISKEKI